METLRKAKHLIPFVIAAVAMAIGYHAMFERVIWVFGEPTEDMSHGWLVPLVSLYALWSDRKNLVKSLARPSLVGALCLIPCYLLALLGTRGLQVRIEQLSFIGFCIALPWAFFGRRAARRCVFPALFLLFTIPLVTYIGAFITRLSLFVSATSYSILHLFVPGMELDGTALCFNGLDPFIVDVAPKCAGIRSLFAILALTAAFAWFNQVKVLPRLVLLAFSVPVAIICNILRVMSICIVGLLVNKDVALGPYHDFSGYLVFILAILLLLVASDLITRCAKRFGKKADNVADAKSLDCEPIAYTRKSYIAAGAIAAVLCVAFSYLAIAPTPMVVSPFDVEFPSGLKGWTVDSYRNCQDKSCKKTYLASSLNGAVKCPACGGELGDVSYDEKTILPGDTRLFKCVYTNPYGLQFVVTYVLGGESRASIHQPELCLPMQNFVMASTGDFEVKGIPFHIMNMSQHGIGPNSALVYTFANQDGFRTAEHVARIFRDVWDRSVLNRVDRWVMMTVFVSNPTSYRGFDMENQHDRKALEEFITLAAKGMVCHSGNR